MAIASPLERSVGWALLGLISLGSVASIAADMTDDDSSSATETSGSDDQVEDPAAGDPSVEAPESTLRSFTVAAAGELLIHEAVAGAAVTPAGWDFSPMLAGVAPVIAQADLAICHVESPMSRDNTSLSYYPVFNVPNELAAAIAAAGFDTCSLASNHALDTGTNGVVGTLEALDAVNVRHAGMARSAREAEAPTIIDVNGVNVAHLSYTYGFNGGDLPPEEPYLSNLLDEGTVLSEAALAKAAGADFVILSVHWGTEYAAAPDTTQTDIGPRLLGSDAIDLVIGHGAHVIQPVTTSGPEYIAYGLGNFLSNQSPESCTGCPPGTQDGVILEFEVTEGPAGVFTVTSISHTPTWVDRTTYEVVPVLADTGTRDPTVLAASADRTSVALSGLGLNVPARPGA